MSGVLTFGSLFAGIGGLDLGLERAGMRCVWQVEKDAYCRAVLAKHWPQVTRYEDVKDVGRANLAPVDLICGGFPCQDISNAGRRTGIRGEQSGLWSEYARIIGELRPRYVLVENVARLLADGMGVVLGDLAAIGYDAEWDCIPASALGAHHQRDRVFLVAYPGCGGVQPDRAVGVMAGSARASEEVSAQRQRVRDATRRSRANLADPLCFGQPQSRSPWNAGDSTSGGEGEATHALDGCLGHVWRTEPDVGRVANGVPSGMERLTALGNAVVPQVAEYIGRLIVQADSVFPIAIGEVSR